MILFYIKYNRKTRKYELLNGRTQEKVLESIKRDWLIWEAGHRGYQIAD